VRATNGYSPAGTSRPRRIWSCRTPPWGAQLLERSYEAARVRDYLFHGFGDTHLILP
jgi:hypothetical protein